MPHLVYSQLKETGQIGHLGGVTDGAFHGVVLGEDEPVDAVGSAGEPGVFLSVQRPVETNVHGRVVGVGKNIVCGKLIQTAVTEFDGDDLVEGPADGFQGVGAVQYGADVEELLHDLHGEGLFPFEKRNARGMWGEGREFVAQHVFQ